MGREQLGRVLDKWASDAAFRTALRRDPAAAVRGAGIALGAEELAALGRMDWRLPDEQLQRRVSKQMTFY